MIGKALIFIDGCGCYFFFKDVGDYLIINRPVDVFYPRLTSV